MSQVYTKPQLWGAIAIAAGVASLAVGGVVFAYMLVRSNANPNQQANQQVNVNRPTSNVSSNVPNETQRSPTGTGLPTTQAGDGTKTTSVPVNGGLGISYPGEYAISVDPEINRRGSFVALDFNVTVATLVAVSPALAEVDFFNADSVTQFSQTCAQLKSPCFEGFYPTAKTMSQERASLQSGTNTTGSELKTFNAMRWIVRQEKVSGDKGFVRRYASFLGDTRVEVTIWMQDATQAAAADTLFQKVQIAPTAA